MDVRRIRIIAAVTIAGLAFAGIVAYVTWQRHREESRSQQLWNARITVGEDGHQVKQRLGPPDHDMPTSEVARSLGACANASGIRAWRYFTGPNGGAYLFLYLDPGGRVTCVDKGLVVF